MLKKYSIYLIPVLIGIVINIIFMINKEWNSLNLSDSFFITSIIFLSVGGYSYILKKGAFSGLAHSYNRLKHIILRPKEEYKGPSTYYEKYMEDLEKRKENRFYKTLLVIGLIELILAFVFTYLVEL